MILLYWPVYKIAIDITWFNQYLFTVHVGLKTADSANNLVYIILLQANKLELKSGNEDESYR